MEFEIGQAWQLVNGEVVVIVRLDGGRALGSDHLWRDYKGRCEREDLQDANFSHVTTYVAEDTQDSYFVLHDRAIKEILARGAANGQDMLGIAREISRETARVLRDLM